MKSKLKKKDIKLQLIVENKTNINTGGDMVADRIVKKIKKINLDVFSLSENNYTLKFFGERFINPFKISKITENLNQKGITLFNYYFDLASLILLIISRFKGNKNIVAFHTFFKKGIPFIDFIYSIKRILLLNLALLFSDKLIFLTKAQKDYFENDTIFKKKFSLKSVIISNGVDNKKIIRKKEDNSKIKLIYVGRLVSQKGSDIILKLTKKKDLFSQFIVIGSGNKETEQNLKRNKSIKYFPEVTHENIYSFYDSSNILILPSYSEVFPLVILEAMARGLVIFVSDIPGMREIIKEGRNGYFFPPGDTDKIKELILYLKKNPSEIKKICKNNLKDIKRFTTQKQVQEYIKLYNQLLKKDDQ